VVGCGLPQLTVTFDEVLADRPATIPLVWLRGDRHGLGGGGPAGVV
jgi:hypothetical protein